MDGRSCSQRLRRGPASVNATSEHPHGLPLSCEEGFRWTGEDPVETPGSCDHVLHIRGLGPARPIVYLSLHEKGWASEGALGGLNPNCSEGP